ncbi:hypothetical protein Bca4012_037165 [Brassica carinata]
MNPTPFVSNHSCRAMIYITFPRETKPANLMCHNSGGHSTSSSIPITDSEPVVGSVAIRNCLHHQRSKVSSP